MTMRIFHDSAQPNKIPLGIGDGVLAYINGDYAWPAGAQVDFIGARKQLVRIDVIGNVPLRASILDVERGDATPQAAKTWIPQRNAYRSDATVYIERANLDELFAVTGNEPYWLIVADWTGSPHELDIPLPRGVRIAGTQFASVPNQFDVSAIYADGWHPVRHKDWVKV